MPLISPETIQNSHPPRGKRSSLLRRYIKLENDRNTWRSHWMELSDYLLPRRGRYLYESQNTRGKKRNNKIIDSTGTQALRTLGAGLMSGMTSPARPWFRYATQDPGLMKRGEVKAWTYTVEQVCRTILHKSNFYNTAYTVYTELGGFGTAPLYRQKSFDTVIRFRPFTAGEYVIGENDEGVVDTVGRHFTMTVSQVIRRFVMQANTGAMDWSGVSKATRRMWENKQYDDLVPIIHLIQPRNMVDRNYGQAGAKNMPFKSCYFEEGGENDDLLQEGGYEKLPVYVPRWDVLSGDIYGRGPGMDTLGDIKQLQHQQKRKAQAIDKMVDPPMVAPTSLRGKPSSVLPGHTTYLDPTQGGASFSPAYQVQPRIQEMQMDIAEVQERIQRGFYADLFAMMINSDRRQMTATEVAERHEEKLVLLGPVLQRLNIELLDPLLDDVFTFALEAGLLPEPPAALEGTDLKIEYVSLLAQAQQAVGASAIERTMSFAGNLAGVFPQISDVVDPDVAIRQYAEILGNSPDLTRGEDVVAKTRADRAAAQQAAQQAAQEQEQLAAAAQGAKTLSEADTQTPNALTALLQGTAGGGGGQTV